jgi:hypothetical protein
MYVYVCVLCLCVCAYSHCEEANKYNKLGTLVVGGTAGTTPSMALMWSVVEAIAVTGSARKGIVCCGQLCALSM